MESKWRQQRVNVGRVQFINVFATADGRQSVFVWCARGVTRWPVRDKRLADWAQGEGDDWPQLHQILRVVLGAGRRAWLTRWLNGGGA